MVNDINLEGNRFWNFPVHIQNPIENKQKTLRKMEKITYFDMHRVGFKS